MKIVQYHVAWDETVGGLIQEVNMMIEDHGWQPFGPLTMMTSEEGQTCAQAMVKYEQPKKAKN